MIYYFLFIIPQTITAFLFFVCILEVYYTGKVTGQTGLKTMLINSHKNMFLVLQTGVVWVNLKFRPRMFSVSLPCGHGFCLISVDSGPKVTSDSDSVNLHILCELHMQQFSFLSEFVFL